MSWRSRLAGNGLLAAAALVGIAGSAFADEPNLWNEFGLVHTETGKHGRLGFTAYRFKDLTGALAAWEWQRSPEGKSCDQAAYCTQDRNRTVVFQDNYVVVFNSSSPAKADIDALIATLPNRTDTTLPAILTFLPRQGLVPNSARYILGKQSLQTFAPELAGSDPGFGEGAEAQVAQYHLDDGNRVRLALFYYATPEMARQHSINFRLESGVHVKRSGVLIAIVYGGASEQEADTLLSRVEYEAKITWNDIPPPSPIKPLYRLLLNIIYASILVSVIGLGAGLVYAGIRLYRRRYGQLEADEAMTTLHLT
jgi:hypothetical protein